jgi:predicted N-acyltransferase
VALGEAQRHAASFVVFVYLGPGESRLKGWPAVYAAAELPDPGTCLPLVWTDFESYLRSLSRSAWKNYRRHRNRAADEGVEVVCQPAVTDLDEAMLLIRNVEQKHGSAAYPWARAALEHAAMVDAIWLTVRVGGRLVGCGSILGDGDVRLLKFLGLDYKVPYAYFQLIYAGIRCAIEHGVRILVGGAGAYETKQRLGFQLVDTNYVVFAGRGPLLGRLGHWLGGKEESKVRDPYES